MTEILLTRDGPVTTLTINRPEVRNAIGPSLIAQLTQIFAALAMDDSRVMVLTGAGTAFSAGADIDWMRASRDLDHQQNVDDAAAARTMFETIDSFPKPVIARVNGHALGGGIGLVACADIAITVPDAMFGFSEVRLGLIPAMISPYVLRAIGPGHARALFTSGRRFGAAEALSLGLVHAVVEPEGLDAAVAEAAADMLRGGPVAIAEAKRLIRDATAPLALPDLAERLAAVRAGPEGQEGLTAFLEKRDPGMDIRRILIANRGEIAVRVIRACRELGIDPVAVHEPDDRGAMHVALAAEAREVESYLDADALIAAAHDCDAVHPGYGYLAENAGFAEAVARAGLRWIGPPPSAMRALGDKVEARRLAEASGVPVMPGYAGLLLDDDTLLAEGLRLGPPLLVKAAAGGGGRGMREVDDPAGLPDAIAAARREAAAAFGDDRVFLERRLAAARHVEVQILCDSHGRGVHLGERDCSIQRRHQKIIEESPSPAVDDELRSQLGAAALAVAGAAGYEGAGTVEFLLDADGGWWFLELNARLQVEHPVTEAVCGIDLVRAQIEVAAGLPLDLEQADVVPRGHAIECRLYAEDPAAGFLPATGTLHSFRLPSWPGVRCDSGVREGDTVGTRYDPLLAKLIAYAADRDACVEKLSAALADTVVLGVTTNLGFLRWALDHRRFRSGEATTSFVAEEWSPALVPPLPDGAAAAGDDLWHRLADDQGDDDPELIVGGGHAVYRGWAHRLAEDDQEPVAIAATAGSLSAPMPGTVLEVLVAEGDAVSAGQVLVLLEAMKMELAVHAPADGTVTAVHVTGGELVRAGQPLAEIGG